MSKTDGLNLESGFLNRRIYHVITSLRNLTFTIFRKGYRISLELQTRNGNPSTSKWRKRTHVHVWQEHKIMSHCHDHSLWTSAQQTRHWVVTDPRHWPYLSFSLFKDSLPEMKFHWKPMIFLNRPKLQCKSVRARRKADIVRNDVWWFD